MQQHQRQQQLIHYSPFESIKVTNALLWLNIYIMIDDKKIKVEQINKGKNMNQRNFKMFTC